MQYAESNRGAHDALDHLWMFGRQRGDLRNHRPDHGHCFVHRRQEHTADIDAQTIDKVGHLFDGSGRGLGVVCELLLDGAAVLHALPDLGQVGPEHIEVGQQRRDRAQRFGTEQLRDDVRLFAGIDTGNRRQDLFNGPGRVTLHALGQLIDVKLQRLERPGFRRAPFGQRLHEPLHAAGGHIGRHIDAGQGRAHCRQLPGGHPRNRPERAHCSHHGGDFLFQVVATEHVDLLGQRRDLRLSHLKR